MRKKISLFEVKLSVLCDLAICYTIALFTPLVSFCLLVNYCDLKRMSGSLVATNKDNNNSGKSLFTFNKDAHVEFYMRMRDDSIIGYYKRIRVI